MRGSLSLEAMLVFVAVCIFWVAVFGGISPRLKEMKQAALEAELRAECLKVASAVDTMASYGSGSTYMSMTPYIGQSKDRNVYFCKPESDACSRKLVAVKHSWATGDQTQNVTCETHVAEWVKILWENGAYTCNDLPRGSDFTVEFGSYVEEDGSLKPCT